MKKWKNEIIFVRLNVKHSNWPTVTGVIIITTFTYAPIWVDNWDWNNVTRNETKKMYPQFYKNYSEFLVLGKDSAGKREWWKNLNANIIIWHQTIRILGILANRICCLNRNVCYYYNFIIFITINNSYSNLVASESSTRKLCYSAKPT